MAVASFCQKSRCLPPGEMQIRLRATHARIAHDFHLGTPLHGLFALAVQFARHRLVQVIFSAVLAETAAGTSRTMTTVSPRCKVTVTVLGAVSPALQMTHLMSVSLS